MLPAIWRRLSAFLVLAAPVVVVTGVSWPVLDNKFGPDELVLLYARANYGVVDLLLTPHGGHSLLTSNVAYVVLHGLFGLDTRYWFSFVVATHLLNVVLLYHIVRIYTRRKLLACICACLWGAAPVHHETLGWFAVCGHVLVATWVLWIMLDVARITTGARCLSTRTLIRWGLLFIMAATSFGVGIGIALAAGGAMGLLLSDVPGGRRGARTLSALVVIVPLLYLGQQLLYQRLSGRPLLHDEQKIVTPTGSNIGVPQAIASVQCLGDLVSYGTASLTFGPLLAFRRPASFVGWLAGASLPVVLTVARATTLVVIGIVALAMRRAPGARRRTVAGLGVLMLAAYTVVAAWWVLTAHTSVQLLLGFPVGCAAVPRYHYAATACIALILALSADQVFRLWPRAARPFVVLGALLAPLLLPSYVSAYRQLDKLTVPVPYEKVLAYVASRAEQQPPGSTVYIENRAFRTWMSSYKNTMLPGWAGIFVLEHPTASIAGRSVRFCERDPELLTSLRAERGTRMAELLIAPDEIPPSAAGCF